MIYGPIYGFIDGLLTSDVLSVSEKYTVPWSETVTSMLLLTVLFIIPRTNVIKLVLIRNIIHKL